MKKHIFIAIFLAMTWVPVYAQTANEQYISLLQQEIATLTQLVQILTTKLQMIMTQDITQPITQTDNTTPTVAEPTFGAVDPNTPTASILVNGEKSTTVNEGDKVEIRWDSSNVNACGIEGGLGWAGNWGKSGTKMSTSLKESTVVTIKCYDAKNSLVATDSATITVTPKQ